ncbi:hypothetical protein FD754_019733 [Muntiacus muntjak]|uniref:Succinate--hydroxymethylglutarate CoA-transferase n=1 Tax=Muntiacus muntjak TaxID=9888 RepID=A0A5N3V135_MUNMU|nr:hypothetical protein FD754_019733 [Muntiacus muntjak]
MLASLARVSALRRTGLFSRRGGGTGLWTGRPQSDTDNVKPLEGVKILDLTRVLAGPFTTMNLGDLGAEVIKVERPGAGDDTRTWGPPFVGTESTYFLSVNRNKKSIAVNIKDPKGVKIVKELAAVCDVFVENYVPGKLSSMGLGYEDIDKIAPHMVYCSITVGCHSLLQGIFQTQGLNPGLLHCSQMYGMYQRKTGVKEDSKYSCLEDLMDRGAWWATDHSVAKSQTRLCKISHDSKCLFLLLVNVDWLEISSSRLVRLGSKSRTPKGPKVTQLFKGKWVTILHLSIHLEPMIQKCSNNLLPPPSLPSFLIHFLCLLPTPTTAYIFLEFL